MKKDSLLLKFIDLWSLGKVVFSASMLFLYTIKTYFVARYKYNALMDLMQAHVEEQVIVIVPPADFINILKEVSEELEKRGNDTE